MTAIDPVLILVGFCVGVVTYWLITFAVRK